MLLLAFITVLATGAIVGGWLHAFSVGFDMFVQDLVWDAPIGVTISSRAGLAARNGDTRLSKIINTIMFNPNHCELAIVADMQRANEAIVLLTRK